MNLNYLFRQAQPHHFEAGIADHNIIEYGVCTISSYATGLKQTGQSDYAEFT